MKTLINLSLLLITFASAGCTPGLCSRSYDVRFVSGPQIAIDGSLDEPAWQKAFSENNFILPWKNEIPPTTEFRAFYDESSFYFSFRVYDCNLVVEKNFTGESTVDNEDRVEIFFAPDDKLKQYFCLEVDPLGRIHDYAASYYRKLDSSWDCAGLCAAGAITEYGYIVEAVVPLKTLKSLGLCSDESDLPFKAGLFRADFYQQPNSEPQVRWVSWVDPGTKIPDFHVPKAFGCLTLKND